MGFDTKNIFGVAEWLACIDTGFESFTQRICNDVLRSKYVITKTVLRSTHIITRHSAAFYTCYNINSAAFYTCYNKTQCCVLHTRTYEDVRTSCCAAFYIQYARTGGKGRGCSDQIDA